MGSEIGVVGKVGEGLANRVGVGAKELAACRVLGRRERVEEMQSGSIK